jgi:thiamine-phosphate pyrophosphorylase
LLTDERRVPDPLPAALALPPGSGVILRHYNDPNRARLAERLARLCRQRRIVLLIAGDVSLAAAVRADGIHLPEHLIALAVGVRRRKKRWLITAAAHSQPALYRAGIAGCDAALLSPVFPTASHPARAALGSLRFAASVRQSRVPVIALGGIDRDAVRRLQGGGHAGIAGIGLFNPRAEKSAWRS